MDLLKVIEDLRSEEPSALSGSQWKDFESSSCWKDIALSLNQWLADSWLELEQADGDLVVRLQARIKCVREMLELPKQLSQQGEQKHA